MKKVLGCIGIGCGGSLILAIVGIFVVASLGPDIYIYTGQQVPKRFMDTVEDLNLLEQDEEVRYLYSDGLMDIKDGLYIVTDRHLVLYSTHWDEPRIILPLNDLESVEAEYDDSFFTDTTVYVATRDGQEASFPLSSEKGMDRRVVEALQQWTLPGTPDPGVEDDQTLPLENPDSESGDVDVPMEPND